MKKNRKLYGALALLIVASTLAVSCADKTEDESAATTLAETEATTEPVETSAFSTIEVNNYEGYTYKIVSTNQDNRHVDFVAEEENGATLNDLVFRRNSKVAETFNITIEAEDLGYGDINSQVQKDVASDDSSYSLYATNSTSFTMASNGYLMDWNEVPHINLEAEYWDQACIDGISVAGKVYLLTGDITPTGMLTSECMLFNKRLLDNRNIEYPYDDAFAGTWTLDDAIAITKDLTEDTNGDSRINADQDTFGLTCWFDYAYTLFYGGGGVMVDKDEGDIPYLAWDLNQQSNIYEKMYSLLIDNKANYETASHERSFKIFNDGRAYFCGITFQKIETFLREMDDDYGVLPIPKYDEKQERYQTCVSGAGTMLVLPVSIREIETVGNITDAMAAASYDMITPDLFDVIAGTKNVRDLESADMVQLIIRNRVFDISQQYGLAGNGFHEELLKKKSKDVASTMEKTRKQAEKTLEKLVDAFLSE